MKADFATGWTPVADDDRRNTKPKMGRACKVLGSAKCGFTHRLRLSNSAELDVQLASSSPIWAFLRSHALHAKATGLHGPHGREQALPATGSMCGPRVSDWGRSDSRASCRRKWINRVDGESQRERLAHGIRASTITGHTGTAH